MSRKGLLYQIFNEYNHDSNESNQDPFKRKWEIRTSQHGNRKAAHLRCGVGAISIFPDCVMIHIDGVSLGIPFDEWEKFLKLMGYTREDKTNAPAVE